MIDFVVMWVDGTDPDHHQKRLKYMQNTIMSSDELNANQDIRYFQNDEIRFCLRSIYNYAPWVNNIFLITDNQFPKSIDKNKAKDHNIINISHEDIFYGYSQLLPTFNSASIETMAWRIPSLSERFILMNDDFFLTRPVKESDFFDGDSPILRGKIKPITSYRKNLHHTILINSSRIINSSSKYFFKPQHVPFSCNRFVLEELADVLGNKYYENATYRFRHKNQFYLIPLMNNFLLSKGMSQVINDYFFHKTLDSNIPPNFSLSFFITTSLLRMKAFKTICVNNYEKVKKGIPKLDKWLDVITGPKAPFEL